MRFAIDLVCTNNNSGSKTYNSKFLKYLSKLKIDDEITIYICESLYNSIKQDLSNNPNIYYEIKKNNLTKIFNRMLWMQFILPFDLKKKKINILYSPLNIIPISKKFFKIKSILCLHSNLPWVYFNKMPGSILKKFFTKFLMELSIKLCDKLIVNSDFAMNEITQKLNLKKKNTKRIYLGLDKNLFNKSIGPYLNNFDYNQEYILSVISCVKYHNIINLIIAFKNLKNKNKINHKFVIVMQIIDKEYYSQIKSLVENCNLKNDILIFENIDNIYLKRLYKFSKLYLFSSYCEVFGLTSLEAMSQKCNVLISNTSSLPEINSNAADYFDPDNINEIENKILLNLFDKTHRDRIIQNSLNRLNFFSWENTVKETLKFIKGN
ncbi:glycosyltransferase [Candidatus Pelagibacter sp.]|nr:glycosyltransferase [Candidatus Pelagibacter sp.]